MPVFLITDGSNIFFHARVTKGTFRQTLVVGDRNIALRRLGARVAMLENLRGGFTGKSRPPSGHSLRVDSGCPCPLSSRSLTNKGIRCERCN